MDSPALRCEPERLRLLLTGELPADQEREAADHLASCAACRERFEALAGTPAWWSDVERCFRSNAAVSHPAATRSFDKSEHGPQANDVEAEFRAADFAVDFLEPCERPGTLGQIDSIEIVGVCGRGGMGIVLRGYQRELSRHVAVKVMAPHLAASGAARQRFAREARAAAAVVHLHVMTIHTVNPTHRLPYLVMPYLDCESLQERLDRQGPLELKQILRIGCQVAAGLAAAHAQGLVHRDVTPGNILLERGVERAVLTDFGLARAADDASLTRTGVIAGTPQFMSPEQARGEAVDARSDLFSLGSVLFALCTGRPPFRAETSLGVLRRICDSATRPVHEINAELPEWLSMLVRRLHSKSPDQRPQSAAEVAQLLAECLSHVQQPGRHALPKALRPRKGETRLNGLGSQRLWASDIGLAAVAGAIFLAALAFLWNAARPAGSGSDRAPSAAASGSAAVDGSSAIDASQESPHVWDDDVGRQLEEATAETDALERRVQRNWDSVPQDPSRRQPSSSTSLSAPPGEPASSGK